jgi:hypothetical protein
MKLKEELQLLRAAAHSYDAVENPNDCLTLIQRGTPYDLTFFAELSDPRWLPLLQTAGVFANVPTTFTRGDVTYYARHAPLFGLTNLAPTAAAEVISILESLEIPENPQVHDQIMRIIRAIDDLSLAPRLVGILRRLFENRSSSEWLWLDEILMKWLQRGARTPCFDALAAFLDTAASDTREHASRQVWQIAELDRKIILPLAESGLTPKGPDGQSREAKQVLPTKMIPISIIHRPTGWSSSAACRSAPTILKARWRSASIKSAELFMRQANEQQSMNSIKCCVAILGIYSVECGGNYTRTFHN